MNILLIIVLVVFATGVFCASFNRYLPVWFCDKLGWHMAPTMQTFDGASHGGNCTRCDKKVMQDSQGNWF